MLGVGRENTKLLGDVSKNTKKTYIAEITLGEQRDTDDEEGEAVGQNKGCKPSLSEIEKVLEVFGGEQEQVPPDYSAIKINGKKSYELARKGKQVGLKKRKVVVYKHELVEYNYPILIVEFKVSSGTYIRALARDIGIMLGTFAYLSNLRRTKID